MQQEHQLALESATNSLAQQQAQQEEAHLNDLKNSQQKSEERLQQERLNHEAKLSELKKNHASQIETLTKDRTESEAKLQSELRSVVADWHSKHSELQARHAQEILQATELKKSLQESESKKEDLQQQLDTALQ